MAADAAWGRLDGMTATLVAVCAVHAIVEGHSDKGRTAIDKRPVAGIARVEELGVVGDTQYDTKHHGGPDQAVYAYAREDAERWAAELGYDVPPGRFGENLATSGVAASDAVIGERWRVGDAVLLEVTLPRVPCQTFKSWMDEPRWVKRFAERGDLGTYLRVLTPGDVQAGDPVEVVHRPAHGLTVRELATAEQQDPARLRRFLDEAEHVPVKARRRLTRAFTALAAR